MSFYGAGSTAAIARLSRACARHGGPEHRLVLDQLSHETEVRRDVTFALFNEVEGALERVVVILHEVGDNDRH